MYSNFQSQTELDARRQETKRAREIILEQAKKKYERAKAKEEQSRREGEGTWMLDSVSQRIKKEEKEIEKTRRKKKKKKDKKEKKDKKSKRKGKSDSSSSASGDDDDDDAVQEWVEAKTEPSSGAVIKGPQLQRESWMEMSLDVIPTTSKQELRDMVKKQKDEANRQANRMLEPGQHARELNPHWKDGGTGLPEEDHAKGKHKLSSATSLPSHTSGDGGLSWLHKAYDRCKQQARDEGRSLEEVTAERWGSLKKLESMIADAERNVKGNGRSRSRQDERIDDQRRDWDRSRNKREGENSRERSRDVGGSKDEESNSNRESGRDRVSYRDGNTPRRSDRESSGSSNNMSRFQRPGSDSESESSSSQRNLSRSSQDDVGHGRKSHPHSESYHRRESSSRKFVKLAEDFDRFDGKDGRARKDRSPNSGVPRWKKMSAVDCGGQEVKEEKRKETETERRSRRSSTSSSSDSSSSSSDHDSESGGESSSDQKQNRMTDPPPAKILSEEELNDMAAKILRAEIMGDDITAANLKSQLENARKAREANKSETGSSVPDFSHRRRDEEKRRKDDKEDNVVILSRTSKGGLVRPVFGSSDDWKTGGGKRRKKSVATHDKKGERARYFDNDDKFDLKSLVEQEKAGTAEDQNSMFARLAGRSVDKDLDVDDMFVSKAAREQNEERSAAKDRAAAIFEHKKLNTAMEKCFRCFEKVPKHLIIAIGTKSYLCLPHHKSLTEGHCFIVPMQHVCAATAMDEDVWNEMQLFRKSLVQMFAAQDQDVVVMETVMHLKHFPHTALECVPLDREMGDLAPIYFKKAIQEAGPEWSDNKKLHSLSQKDVRHVIPKGFPYFSVDFGLQGGYATVIEDESRFPVYFGREIVGGMLDAEPTLWRKPHKQSFEEQRQKVLQFARGWQPYDWTQKLAAGD